MLIIAMPKSASSSLARTLARAHGLDERNDELNADHPPQFVDRHLLAQEFHPYPAVPTEVLRSIATDPRRLNKLHLFPTPAVLEAVRGTPVVVLLRDPADIIDAEFRARVTGIHPPTRSMPRVGSLRGWRRAAIRGGLLTSLEELEAGWIEAATRTPDELLVVRHRDVLDDPDGTLGACQQFLGLPEVAGLTLLKERWTGPRDGAGTQPGGAIGTLGYILRTTAWRGRRALERRIRDLVSARAD